MRKLDIIFPAQHTIWGRVNPIQVRVVEGELNSDELHARRSAGVCGPVLHR